MSRRWRLYLFGGSFNPPGLHHEHVVQGLQTLCEGDDLIVIVPCGVRPDKGRTNDVDSTHRAAMVELTFQGMSRVHVDLFDLEADAFTRTWNLDARYRQQFPDTDIWHVVGTDLVKDGASHNSEIHRWYRGPELFLNRPFVVVTRADIKVPETDYPRNHIVLDLQTVGSSTRIRNLRAERSNIDPLVNANVRAYIERWHLYTGRPHNGWTHFQTKGPGLIRAVPPYPGNPWPQREERVRHLTSLARAVNADRVGAPDHVLVIGGDGWMLDVIARDPREALPFIGLNAGTEGYLLNGGTIEELTERLELGIFTLLREPLLRILLHRPDGGLETVYAFNEGFLRSQSENSGWMRVAVDGQVVFDRLMGDGLMLATAGGSTGWSKAKGGQAWWIGAPHMVLTGDGTTCDGRRWVTASIENESVVEIEVLDTHKRPMRLVVDGKNLGPVTRVVMNRSHAQAVELGFFPQTVQHRRLERIRNG